MNSKAYENALKVDLNRKSFKSLDPDSKSALKRVRSEDQLRKDAGISDKTFYTSPQFKVKTKNSKNKRKQIKKSRRG
jgi:hypothetical protein